MSKPTVKHSGLSSTFVGVFPNPSDTEVWQFRGIKYGIISARFTQSKLNEEFPAEYNATAYGPKCPHVNLPIRMEDGLIGIPPDLASHQEHIFDEFNCLNLNITVPANIQGGSNLPVLLYIHGGGGHSGANSDWWCDGSSIVKQSIKLEKPIIFVAINYRLTVLGHLGSKGLQEELGEENGSNFSFRDQHTATEWVWKYIAPFGGDLNNITIYGESSGAIGVHSQISSLVPSYFSRAILQSMTLGTFVVSNLQSIEDKSSVYNKVKEQLNITTVKELQEVPWQDLVNAYNASDPPSWRDRLGFAGGKGELLIGTTGAEETVASMVLLQYPEVSTKPSAESLINKLKDVISPEKIDALLAAYTITADISAEDFASKLLLLYGGQSFYAPANWISKHAKNHSVEVREYAFEQKQPFGGPCKGKSSHSLDLAYLHGDPSIFSALPTAEQELNIQKEIQETWIEFAHGETGWKSNEVKVFGPEGKVKVIDEETFLTELRRGAAYEAARAFDEAESFMLVMNVIGHLAQCMGTTVVT